MSKEMDDKAFDMLLRFAAPSELREMVQTLTRERDEARAHWDLAQAQLLMVGSELCGDPKIDPADHRDPRHTPTLVEAARLRRERDEARKISRGWETNAERWSKRCLAVEADAARLRGALEPFARDADYWGSNRADSDHMMILGDDGKTHWHSAYTFGDLRQARAALAGEGEVNEEEEEAIIRDHFFMADPHHPNQCRVHVPVMEAGSVVGTCCGYPAAAHQPTPEKAREA